MNPSRQVLVSACLLGKACRYDAGSKPNPDVMAQVEALRADGVEVVAVCPEELGGLSTPRPAADLRGGDGHAVLDGAGSARTVASDQDVTDAFVGGAHRSRALGPHADTAILKARSPSCGVGQTYVEGVLTKGDGVFAALLRRDQVTCMTEEDLRGSAVRRQREHP